MATSSEGTLAPRSAVSLRLGALGRLPLVPLGILIAVTGAAAFAPWVAPYRLTQGSLLASLEPPVWLAGGSSKYLLGTDFGGRDILSRIIWGGRVSLTVAAVCLVLGAALGLVLGVVSGYFGGWIDGVIMRLTDISLALPFILLAMVIIAIFGTSLFNVIAVIALGTWAQFARIIRGETLSIRERGYVKLAEVAGASPLRILAMHIAPNVLNTLVVLATLTVARVILLESALSFLGLGIQPPSASWGLMLAEGRNYISSAWWLVTFPGIAITATVLSLNLLGDWLRDALDPQRRPA